MSNMNGTGPRGEGPMTGGRFGFCAKESQVNKYARGGCNRGRGFGFVGRTFSVQDEIVSLENEEKILKEELEAIRSKKDFLVEQK